ncbi:MAG TPA: hypothetical protein VJP02_14140 [Candidatus Sulfotelmatobacter sp.]|nr:hypothetical protein [Candidatus Sulfotelmatobacter sp.]
MRNVTLTATVVVALSCFSTVAQGPPALDTFNSPDGTFQFVYPETYELLVGERILKATQGRNHALPVCDFSTALVCVIYPLESEHQTRLEAAGFSVDTVPSVTSEADCLAFADDLAKSRGTQLPLTSVSIHSRLFQHAPAMKKLPGHLQTADFYRIFTQQKCYELQIEVSISDDPVPQKVAISNSLGDATASSARESLKLILSSVVFEKE